MLHNMEDSDLALARQLQEEFDREAASRITSPPPSSKPSASKSPVSIVDGFWELTDPNPDIRALFLQYNARFFWGKLAGIEVKWSPRMTLCAGVCVYERRGGLCSVRLSTPLLKLRPRKDLVETLLHEMIHAYLFVTQNDKDHDGHGPEFQKHMNRINKETGTNISIYHNFHDEVAEYRQHWWRCNGPCQHRPPYFGYVKRSMNRAPAPRDTWWGDHQRTCGGTYTKVKEPEGYGQKKGKKDNDGSKEDLSSEKSKTSGPDIRSFWGQGQISGSKVTSVKKPPSSTVTSGQSDSARDDPQLPTLPSSQMKNFENGNQGKTNFTSAIPIENEDIGSTSGISTSLSDPSRRPTSSATSSVVSRVPTNSVKGPTIKTIWDDGTSDNTKTSKPPSSGGPQICDINSVDSYGKESKSSSFSGYGHVLGANQDQGTSFLAQLRREMNNSKKCSEVKKTDSSLLTSSSSNEIILGKDKTSVLNKMVSPQSCVKNKTVSPQKSMKTKTPSPQKSIKEWIMSESPKKSPHSPTIASPSSDRSFESNSSHSRNRTASPVYKKESFKNESNDSLGTSKSKCIDLSEEDDDFSSPRKPLFKKVNPASNFTSPPYKRVSLYNNDSPSKQPSASCSRGDNSQSPGGNPSACAESFSSKRKHSSHDGFSKTEGGKPRLKSWTRKPQYSTSDDSDIEEIRPPAKKFKSGNQDKRKTGNPDGAFHKGKHKDSRTIGGNSVRPSSSKGNSNKSGSSSKDNESGQSSVRSGGGNSSSNPTDSLQCCPVCQTPVPASQINTHLDQCLTFG